MERHEFVQRLGVKRGMLKTAPMDPSCIAGIGGRKTPWCPSCQQGED